MIIGADDDKLTVDNFKGLYSRGSVDDVPLDHAQDCLNLSFSAEGHAKTRDGLTKSVTIPHSGIRRFFLMEWIPANYLESTGGDPSATEGKQLLHLDNSNHLYIGDNPTALFTLAGMSDFAAMNVANRVLIAPNNGKSGFQKARLQVLDPATAAIRDAAGPAPELIGSVMSATLSVTAGVVPAGTHKFAVIYETDTGYWTPPGPKIEKSVTLGTAGKPTILSCTAHGMNTGESHRISGATGTNWQQINDIWHITRISDNLFSIPVDSTGFGSLTGTVKIAAGFLPATAVADGTTKIDLSGIPLGPSYVTRRLIIATRADEEEYFFVPNVTGCVSVINDNTANSTTVDFNDTDLVDSADYLFDILEAIPAGSSMCKYRKRVIYTGVYLPGIQERVLVSNISDPETVGWVSGYIQVQSERDGNDVRSCYVLRDTLYIAKFTGTFSAEDNGRNPSTWALSAVDGIIGSYAYGTSTFTVSQNAPDTGDVILIAARSGLYLFDGVMRRPELTWKIQKEWIRINFAAFERVTVAHDPWNHLIFVSCPFDSATEPNTLLVGDYTDGRDPEKIRWCKWTLHKNPTCIGMAYFGSSISTPFTYTLKIGSIDATTPNLYSLTPGALGDDGSIITSHYTPGSFRFGGVGDFKYIVMRARGVGRLNMTVTALDDTLSTTPTFFTLTASPGREFYRQINLVNEKMNLKMQSGTTLNDYMILDRIDIWGNVQMLMRPSV